MRIKSLVKFLYVPIMPQPLSQIQPHVGWVSSWAPAEKKICGVNHEGSEVRLWS